MLGRVVLNVLSLGVGAYALVAYSLLPLGSLVHPEMRATFVANPVSTYAHIFGAAFALLLGPFQFAARLRARRPGLHRALGRLYLGVGVLVGGVAGLMMAARAFGGLGARSGFGLLAALWLATGALALRAALRRDFAAHRRWMIRNFALALAAVTIRVYLTVGALAGLAFESIYPLSAWACWVPNLLVAEWVLQAKKAASAGTMITDGS